MADDKGRLVKLVRSARFDAEGMCDEHDNCMVCPAGSKNGGECVDGYIADRLLANGVAVIPETGMGDFSDGYHPFNELYHHRAMLFSVICNTMPERAWKSKQHHDGTMYDGMFIVGIDTPEGQATYHYDVEPYWDMFDVRELDRAPVFDGHTPDIAIRRIAMMAPSRAEIKRSGRNVDYIRRLSNRGLAEFLAKKFCDFDVQWKIQHGQTMTATEIEYMRSIWVRAFAEWLRMPYEEGELWRKP